MLKKGRSLILIVFAILLWSPLGAEQVMAQEGVAFIARRDYVVGGGPRFAAVGDFNKDSIDDLAIVQLGC